MPLRPVVRSQSFGFECHRVPQPSPTPIADQCFSEVAEHHVRRFKSRWITRHRADGVLLIPRSKRSSFGEANLGNHAVQAEQRVVAADKATSSLRVC